MNKIYKSIWNSVTRSWTAVSEWQKSKGKASKCQAVVSTFLLTLCSSAFAIDLTDTVGIGIGSSVQHTDKDVTYYAWSDKEYKLDDTSASLNLDFDNKDNSAQLFSQSQGIEFKLYSVGGDFRKGPQTDSDQFTVTNTRSATGTTYQQTIQQDGKNVANATYIIGQEARDFFVNVLGYQTDADGRITVDDELYSSTGINHNSIGSLTGDVVDDPEKGVWTLAILRNLELNDGQTLSLNADHEYNWYANLSGTGSIEYKSTQPNATIIINSHVSSDESNYTGETTVDGVTVYLLRNKSLGNTSLLEILNDGRVYANTKTEKVNALQVSNGILFIQNEGFEVSGKAVIGTEGEIQGQNVALNVTDGGELLVQNSNTNLVNSAVTANKITVTTADAFGSETKATATTVTIENMFIMAAIRNHVRTKRLFK